MNYKYNKVPDVANIEKTSNNVISNNANNFDYRKITNNEYTNKRNDADYQEVAKNQQKSIENKKIKLYDNPNNLTNTTQNHTKKTQSIN